MKILIFFDKLMRFFEKHVMITLMVFICFLLLLQTFTRYVLNNPLSRPEEILRFSFVSMIYFAISNAAALEPFTSLPQSVDPGTLYVIPAGQTIATELKALVISGRASIHNITPDGNVIGD